MTIATPKISQIYTPHEPSVLKGHWGHAMQHAKKDGKWYPVKEAPPLTGWLPSYDSILRRFVSNTSVTNSNHTTRLISGVDFGFVYESGRKNPFKSGPASMGRGGARQTTAYDAIFTNPVTGDTTARVCSEVIHESILEGLQRLPNGELPKWTHYSTLMVFYPSNSIMNNALGNYTLWPERYGVPVPSFDVDFPVPYAPKTLGALSPIPTYPNEVHRGRDLDFYIHTLWYNKLRKISGVDNLGKPKTSENTEVEQIISFVDYDILEQKIRNGQPFQRDLNQLAYSAQPGSAFRACLVLRTSNKTPPVENVWNTRNAQWNGELKPYLIRTREIHTAGISTKFDKGTYKPNSIQVITASDLGLRPDQTLEDYIGVKKVNGKWYIVYCVRESYLPSEKDGTLMFDSTTRVGRLARATTEILEDVFVNGEIRYIEILNNDLISRMNKICLRCSIKMEVGLYFRSNTPTSTFTDHYLEMPYVCSFIPLTRRVPGSD